MNRKIGGYYTLFLLAFLLYVPPAFAQVKPSISSQPRNVSVVANQPATFTVGATGEALSYQWQRTAGRRSYLNIAGANLPTYTIASTQQRDNNAQFRVRVWNSRGSALSTAAHLTVRAAPITEGLPPNISYRPCTVGGVTYPTCTCVTDDSNTTRCHPFSPISLIWEEGTKVRSQRSVTTFPLAPDKPEGTKYRWYGSAKTPLLVYDPEQTGVIRSASQLFGNYFQNKVWRSGYHALRSLDANQDGKISGEELSALALWFDRNGNGISKPGEVVPLSETGVTELYYRSIIRPKRRPYITVRRGYKRINAEGKPEVLRSIDWFTKIIP